MAIIRNVDNLMMTVPDAVVADYVDQGWQDLSALPVEAEPKPKRARKKTDN